MAYDEYQPLSHTKRQGGYHVNLSDVRPTSPASVGQCTNAPQHGQQISPYLPGSLYPSRDCSAVQMLQYRLNSII